MKIKFWVAAGLLFSMAGCTLAKQSTLNTKNDANMKTQEKQAVESLLKAYESALNTADTKTILEMYTEDGIFMPSEAPSSIGKIQVEQAYNFVFSQIKLHIEFFIDEVEIIDKDYAFARTISRGKTDILASNTTVPEENRELFILQKEKGEWKIARYIFNKMSPQAK